MSFIKELKRRNVFRVALAYVAVAWLLIQVVETLFPVFELSVDAIRIVVIILAIGFIPSAVFAWIFEITPEGLMREKDIDRELSTTHVTGKQLDRAIVVVMALALSYFAFDKFVLDPARDKEMAETVATQARTEARVEFFGDKSVAVLPFANVSGDPANEPFTVGIHDDLVTHISRIGSIKTISRISISQYQDTTKKTAQIAQELGVATILKAGVHRAGDQVRINVQLINAATDSYLWAETFDRELTVANIFAIQSEIATSIANALNLVLSQQEVDQLHQVSTHNLQAYDALLTGNEFIGRPTTLENTKTAKRMYERAIELDPNFAAAWANLSLCHSTFYWFAFDRSETRREQAQEALARARALQPDLPEAYIAAGYYYYWGFRDYEVALEEFAKAEKLLPGDARVMAAQGYIQRRLGLWNESLDSLERAIVRDPRNADLIQGQAGTFERIGRYEEAKQLFDRAQILAPDSSTIMFKKAVLVYGASGDTSALREFTVDYPGSLAAVSDYARWWVEFLDGDYEAALKVLESWDMDVFSFQIKFFPRALLEGLSQQYLGNSDAARLAYESALAHIKREAPLPSDEPRIMIAYGMAYAGLGESETAVSYAYRALELLKESRELQQAPFYEQDAIFVLSMAGADAAAIAQLSAYLEEPSNTTLTALRADPRVARLESHADFQKLLQKK